MKVCGRSLLRLQHLLPGATVGLCVWMYSNSSQEGVLLLCCKSDTRPKLQAHSRQSPSTAALTCVVYVGPFAAVCCCAASPLVLVILLLFLLTAAATYSIQPLPI